MTFTVHTNASICIKENSKSKINKTRLEFIKSLGFKTNMTFIGSEINTPNNIKHKSINYDLSSISAKNKMIFYFDVNGKTIGLNSTNSILGQLMIHNSNKKHIAAKSKTHDTTLLKELITKYKIEYPMIQSDEILLKIKELRYDLLELYDDSYYISAIKQSNQFHSYLDINPNDYIFEMQLDNYNKLLYDKVFEYTKIHKDNWNPADIWIFKKEKLTSFIDDITKLNTLKDINNYLKNEIILKNIIPLSIKHIINNVTMQECNMGKNYTTDLNFDIIGLNISKSFKSLFVNTNSTYQFKLNMRGSAASLNLNKEGTHRNKNASEGAFGANLWDYYLSQNKPRNVLSNGVKTPYLTEEIFKKKQLIFVKYKDIISNEIYKIQFTDLDRITGQRYQIIADHVEYIMEHQDIVQFSYYASKKIYDGAGPFYIISEQE